MNLQDVQLPPLVINELYRDLLVDIEDANAPLPASRKYITETVEALEPQAKAADITPVKLAPVEAPATQSIQESEPLLFQAPETKSHTAPVAETANTRIKFLGGNKKRIAFIVNSATDVYLPDAHLDWLQKMLEACRLNLGDVAIANVAKIKFSISDIKEELFSNTVILLGAEPSSIQLPINFPHFNLQQHDGITFLATPPPDQLNQSTADARLLKSKLWVSLQKLFKL